MATVTGLTAERMLEIEAESIVAGQVNSSGELILSRHDGTPINAGIVKGPKGDDATALLEVDDTTTVDLTKTGAGTAASPWHIKADVKTPAVEATTLTVQSFDPNTNGWFLKGADGVTYGPYPAASNYFPGLADDVWIKRRGLGNYVIEGYLSPWKPLTGGTSNRTYNDFNADNQWQYLEYTVRNGFVNLRGLLSFATTTVSQLIGILPVGARPDQTVIFKVNNSDVIRSLYLYPNGEVRANAVTAGGFYSLDGIIFPVAGKANWTWVGDAGSGLAFANGWTHFSNGSSQFGKVGFWRDEYDFVWMTGLVAGGTVSTNVNMITITNPNFLPWDAKSTGSTSTGEQHVMTTGADVGVVLNIAGGSINAVRGSTLASNAWVSLAGVHYLTNTATAHPDWVEHPTKRGMAGGWVNYGIANYPSFAYRQRADGLNFTKGLIKSGALGRLDWIPDGMRSDRSHLMSNAASAAYARFDIQGRQNTSSPGGSGLLNLISGSNTWFSFDGQHWIR